NPRNPFYTQIKANAAGWGVEIRAVSTLIENLDFNKGSATTGIIHFSGDNGTTHMGWGSLVSNCHIRNASSGANAGVTMYGGSYNTIYDTIFEACHTGVRIQSGGTFPIRSLKIQKCSFKGSNASAVGGDNIADIGASCIVYELEIDDCRFEREPTGTFITLTTNTYGLISKCHFGHAGITVSSEIVIPATVFLAECYDDEDVMIKTA
ncbi:hypothetical protein KA005_54305, partial [bacterium]|nr:hypothetical protein [bacterium]